MAFGPYHLALLTGLFSLVLAATPAWATPDYLGLQGLRPSTMGGAVVADGDDHWTGWYNVANLGPHGKKLAIDFDISGIYNNATYVRRDDGQLSASFSITPKISGGISGNLGPHVTLGLHYYSLYQATQQFEPNEVAGRTIFSDKGSSYQSLQLSAVWKFNQHFAFGLGLQNFFVFNKQLLSVSTAPSFATVYNTATDKIIQLDGHDYCNLSATIGLTIRPSENFAIGFSSQLPFTADITGTVMSGEDKGIFKTTVEIPLILRLGIRYTRPQTWAVEIATTYEHTATRKQQMWHFADLGFPLTQLATPLNRTDSFSISLGGSYQLLPTLELRAGFMYKNNTVADADLTPYNYDSHKVILGFGPSYRFKFGLRIDLGYAFYYFVERNEAQSSTPPFTVATGSGPKIGNGTYGYGIHTFGLGLGYEL